MDWIASLPLVWSILFFWALAICRATVTFTLGRGMAKGAEHTALRRYMAGPIYERAMRFVDKWGPWAIPLCFLTVGIQTAVIGSAGVAKMRWRRFIPAMLLGTFIWGIIYGTVGMAVVWTVIWAVLGNPWAIPALIVVVVGIFLIFWWRTGGFARLRASIAQRRLREAKAAAQEAGRGIGQDAADKTSDVGR